MSSSTSFEELREDMSVRSRRLASASPGWVTGAPHPSVFLVFRIDISGMNVPTRALGTCRVSDGLALRCREVAAAVEHRAFHGLPRVMDVRLGRAAHRIPVRIGGR